MRISPVRREYKTSAANDAKTTTTILPRITLINAKATKNIEGKESENGCFKAPSYLVPFVTSVI
jgi:hypothetical protein